MFGLLKGAVKGTVLLAALAALAGTYGYYRLAASKLAPEGGAVVTAGICRTTPSLSGGTLPVTFEAFVKDARWQNFLATGRSTGLVKARHEWSHARHEWVEDRGFAERQVRERRRLAARDVEALIRDLRSDDPIAREVSARELAMRTGQAFGYAYDGPAAERGEAARTWERWWADDGNRLKYGAKRTIDGADRALGEGKKALDTLRRAIEGEGK